MRSIQRSPLARRIAPATGLAVVLGIALAPPAPAQTPAPVYAVT
jgi:hypothetical protein